MKYRDKFFSLVEILVDAIKYQGIIYGIKFIYSSIKVKFFAKKENSSYKIFGMKFNYFNRASLTNSIFELFGTNIYYFDSVNDKPIIIDIGANVGDTILYFKWLYPKSIIYAFEPNPAAYDLLKKNVKSNNFQDIFYYNYALGKQKGNLELYDDNSNVYNFSTFDKEFLTKTLSRLRPGGKVKSVTVSVEKISENYEIQKLSNIDMVKIDIEGAEQGVLEDLKPFYKKIDKLILEYHMLERLKNNSFDYIYNLLSENDFTVNISGFYRNIENLTNPNVFMITAIKNEQ